MAMRMSDWERVQLLQGRLSEWNPDEACQNHPKGKCCTFNAQGGLIELHLCGLGLKQVPSEVWQFSALQSLSLYNNQLSALPKEVSNLTVLRDLSLYNNQLSALPKEVGSLTALQRLNLNNNPWKTPLPQIIAQGRSAILEYLRRDALDKYLTLQQSPLYSQQALHTIKVFYLLYAYADKGFREELEKHMSGLRLQRLIADRHDGYVPAVEDWEQAVRSHIETAEIVLLLVSTDFMATDFMASDDREVQRVMQRHARGETRVVPILLRPVDWTGVPFASLSHLPSTGEPITRWVNRDDAFLNIVQGLRMVVQEVLNTRFEGVQRDLEGLHGRIDGLRDPYTEIEGLLERLSDEEEDLGKQCRTIEDEIAALQRRLQGLQQQGAALAEKRQRLEGERQEMRDEALEIRERESRLEQEAEALRGQIERVKH